MLGIWNGRFRRRYFAVRPGQLCASSNEDYRRVGIDTNGMVEAGYGSDDSE